MESDLHASGGPRRGPLRSEGTQEYSPWRQLCAAGFVAVVIMSSTIAGLSALVHKLTN